MKITIISGSTRNDSQSLRVANYLSECLKKMNIYTFILDLNEKRLPLYDDTEEVYLTPSTLIPTGTTTYTNGSVVYRVFVPVTDTEFATMRIGNEGQKIGWFTYEELLKLNVSPHSFVYYRTYEQDIKEIMSGKRDFIPRIE